MVRSRRVLIGRARRVLPAPPRTLEKIFHRRLAWICYALVAWPTSAQQPEIVGRIEGAFTARGIVETRAGPDSNQTMLRSGSEVVVPAAHARLVLEDGGEIDICGPAQFSLLKSGGALTLALSYGRIHARINPALPLTVYTAQVVATPVSVADQPRDFVISLDTEGGMCVYAPHGAVRLEHQFSGLRVLVPQQGEMTFAETNLESLRDLPGGCRCDIPVAKAAPTSTPAESSMAAETKPEPETPEKREPPRPAVELPVYTAIMPPLTYDASAAITTQPDAARREQMILLIREVRVRPAVVYTGRVEPREKSPSLRSSAGRTAAGPSASSGRSGGDLKTVLKNFFRRLFGRKPKP